MGAHFLNVLFPVASYADRSYYGPPEYQCPHCQASFWFEESVQSSSSWTQHRIVYNLCCKGGKVVVKPFKKPPPLLNRLLSFDGDRVARQFLPKIRQYNCMFAFTSMGATVDRSLEGTRGPNIFKICGQVHHRIGSLLPSKDDAPKFAEMYIYDTANEVDHRMNAVNLDGTSSGQLDRSIVVGLKDMLDEHNSLVKQFRTAKERLEGHVKQRIAIRIIAPGDGDGPQYNLPTTNDLAALIVGDFTLDAACRDIIIHDRVEGLQQISSLHPAYMSLQYPLLFPYGESAFQIDVPYKGLRRGEKTRGKVTMQDYYCYACHYRPDQPNPYLCYGPLSSQVVVDCRACIDEQRLWYILRHQDDLRSEHMQGITDAIGQGCVDGATVGKKTILPSSHTAGRRYYQENFQDGLAVCRVHGAPDIFTTFTCNPKWPEIAEALLLEPGQKPRDRADIIVRVYKMKLDEYLDEIKSGRAYGPIKCCTLLSSRSAGCRMLISSSG